MNASPAAIAILTAAIAASGIFSVGLGPANKKCRTPASLQLFNALFAFVAFVCAAIFAAAGGGGFRVPASGVFAAAAFGVFFYLTVLTNLKALESGPLSLTTLIVNFSLIMPMGYSFIFLHERITVTRTAGLALLVVCMFLFTDPRVTGEAKISGRWIGYSLLSLLCSGTLSLISKIYATKTENAYFSAFLVLGYAFASAASFAAFLLLRSRGEPAAEKASERALLAPAMIGVVLYVGCASFALNLAFVLLATMMDSAIVYPAVQGGGPIVTAVLSRLFFGERIPWKKGAAILLGAAAIVLLNL